MKLNLESIKKELSNYITIDNLYLYYTESYNKELLVLESEGEEYFFNLYEYSYVSEKYLVFYFLEQIEEIEGENNLVSEFKKDCCIDSEEEIKESIIKILSTYLHENLDYNQKALFDSLKFDYTEQFGESEEIPTTFIREWVEVQPLEEIGDIDYIFSKYYPYI